MLEAMVCAQYDVRKEDALGLGWLGRWFVITVVREAASSKVNAARLAHAVYE
jgi:hypothetical protein